MFRKLALVATLAALFVGADATKDPNTKIKTTGTKVPCNTRARKVKEFSICLYVPYGSGDRRLDAEEEERDLGEVEAAGYGIGYFGFLAGYNYFAANLDINYISAIMYDCDSGDELGTYGVFCQGDLGFFGDAVQSDCEHNFAFAGEPGSALVLHTSNGLYGTTVTTLGASGKFYKNEVVSADFFRNTEDGVNGFTLGYKTNGHNPLNAKEAKGPKTEKVKAPKAAKL